MSLNDLFVKWINCRKAKNFEHTFESYVKTFGTFQDVAEFNELKEAIPK